MDERIARVVKDAADAGRASVLRLEETVARMKVLTNLDRAEIQLVDLNQLWRDTIHFMDDSLAPRVSFVLDSVSDPEGHLPAAAARHRLLEPGAERCRGHCGEWHHPRSNRSQGKRHSDGSGGRRQGNRLFKASESVRAGLQEREWADERIELGPLRLPRHRHGARRPD